MDMFGVGVDWLGSGWGLDPQASRVDWSWANENEPTDPGVTRGPALEILSLLVCEMQSVAQIGVMGNLRDIVLTPRIFLLVWLGRLGWGPFLVGF